MAGSRIHQESLINRDFSMIKLGAVESSLNIAAIIRAWSRESISLRWSSSVVKRQVITHGLRVFGVQKFVEVSLFGSSVCASSWAKLHELLKLGLFTGRANFEGQKVSHSGILMILKSVPSLLGTTLESFKVWTRRDNSLDSWTSWCLEISSADILWGLCSSSNSINVDQVRGALDREAPATTSIGV